MKKTTYAFVYLLLVKSLLFILDEPGFLSNSCFRGQLFNIDSGVIFFQTLKGVRGEVDLHFQIKSNSPKASVGNSSAKWAVFSFETQLDANHIYVVRGNLSTILVGVSLESIIICCE